MEPVDFHLQKLRQIGDAPLKPCVYLSDKFQPIPPHKVGIAHLVLKPRFLLADPTGCGKTVQSLAAFGFLKQRDPKLRLLVMVEKGATIQWYKSVAKFLVNITPTVVGYDLATGNSVSRHSRYSTYEDVTADVYILSYHQMARDIDVILHNVDNYVVAYDEVHHLKTYRTAESSSKNALYQSALKLSMKGRYVWGLSATPQMNGSLEELYGIMEVIRPGTFGSFEDFKQRYCEFVEATTRQGGRLRTYLKIDHYKNIPDIMRIVRPFILRRPAKLIDDHLPEVVTKEVNLTMLPDQAKIYNDITKKGFPREDGSFRKLNKLTSVTYGQLASDSPETLGLEGSSSKMEWLLNYLDEQIVDEKIIIYARFRRSVDFICSKLRATGRKHTRITGAESKATQRNQAKEIFNDPSSGVNIICINKAGGSSLDLQQASIVIFYDLPWSWGEWDQVLGRARRIGSPHSKVLALILINQNSIDRHVLNILRLKESRVSQTIGVDGRTLDTEGFIDELYEQMLKAA